MPRKAETLMRVLAVINVLEGAGGLFMVALALDTILGPFRGLVPGTRQHAGSAVYAMAFANVAFACLLFISASLLWRLKRSGLLLLLCTLCSEVVYFLTLVATLMHRESARLPHSQGPASAFAPLFGFANMGLGVQVLTAYPLIAGVLIFLAYRSIAIPARS
jgi:hypothetical protein